MRTKISRRWKIDLLMPLASNSIAGWKMVTFSQPIFIYLQIRTESFNSTRNINFPAHMVMTLSGFCLPCALCTMHKTFRASCLIRFARVVVGGKTCEMKKSDQICGTENFYKMFINHVHHVPKLINWHTFDCYWSQINFGHHCLFSNCPYLS